MEAFYDYQNLNETEKVERDQKIQVLQNIFQLLKYYGYVLIDEVDSILDIMSSHRFSIGNRIPLESSLIQATSGLFRILLEDPEISKQVKLPFLSTFHPGSAPYSPESYQSIIKDRLIQRLLQKGRSKYFNFKEKGSSDAFDGLNQDKLREYFESQSYEGARSFIQELPNDELKNVISVLFTQIHQVLPMTLGKSYKVHFGLCPKEIGSESERARKASSKNFCDTFLAIPYHSGSPIVTSRFGTELETLNYTIQSHLEERDLIEMFSLEVDRLVSLYRRSHGRNVRKKLQHYFGKELSDVQIFNLTSHEIQTRAQKLSSDPKIVLDLTLFHAVPKIEVFKDQIFANPYIYPMIFNKIHGMTGTLWNYESFPEFYEDIHHSDSSARTLISLWKNSSTHRVKIIDSPIVGEGLESILSRVVSNTKSIAIIDEGGIFKGLDNEEVVRNFFQVQKNTSFSERISQLIFYDKNHQITLAKEKGNDLELEPYSQDKIDRNKTGAFWDMQHTTGSDLKIHPEAQAILTLSKFSVMRDLLQSVWRLRDLERGQSVVFLIPRDDLKVISHFLVKHFGSQFGIRENAEEVELGKILLYLAAHEASKVGEMNCRSVKSAQRAMIIQSIFEALIDSNLLKENRKNLLKSFDQIKFLFSQSGGCKPFERYGIPIVQEDSRKFLSIEMNRLKNPVGKVFLDSEYLFQNLNDLVLKKFEILPDYVSVAIPELQETENEMEIEAEQDQEQDQEEEEEEECEFENFDVPFNKYRFKWNKDRFIKGDLIKDFTQLDGIPPDRISVQELTGFSPVARFSDILMRGGFGNVATGFSEKIFASLNLFPVFQTHELMNDQPFEPFGVYQGLINFVLVELDRNLELQSATLITRDEALKELGSYLILDQDEEKSKVSGKIYLIYQFGNGFIRQSNFLTREYCGALPSCQNLEKIFNEISSKENFQEVLVQIKFLSGRLDYTEEEKNVLFKWFQEKGDKVNFYSLFVEHILKYKKETKESFKDSELELFFENDKVKIDYDLVG